MKRKRAQYAVPPAGLTHDLAYAGSSDKALSELCGVSRMQIVRIRRGLAVRKAILDLVTSRFYAGGQKDDFAICMQALLQGSKARFVRVMGMLEQAACLVEAYRDVFRMRKEEKDISILPPRSCLLQLSDAIEAAYGVLRRIYGSYPTLRIKLFDKARKLEKEFHNGIRSRREPGMCEMQGTSEAVARGSGDTEGSVCTDEGPVQS